MGKTMKVRKGRYLEYEETEAFRKQVDHALGKLSGADLFVIAHLMHPHGTACWSDEELRKIVSDSIRCGHEAFWYDGTQGWFAKEWANIYKNQYRPVTARLRRQLRNKLAKLCEKYVAPDCFYSFKFTPLPDDTTKNIWPIGYVECGWNCNDFYWHLVDKLFCGLASEIIWRKDDEGNEVPTRYIYVKGGKYCK